MQVVVVESPAKAKTVRGYLGAGYEVFATRDHVRDLPAKDGSVDPARDFALVYATRRSATPALRRIAAALRKADGLVLATDPDREGEAIAWQVLEWLREKGAVEGKPVRRIVFHEVTAKAVRSALERPRNLDMDLVRAQQARRALDYLVGFHLSALLWRKIRGGRSAGRVQSVALRLVCAREAEIETFEPEEYWTFDADVMADSGGNFTARLNVLDGEERDRLALSAGAAAAAERIRAGVFRVASLVRDEVRREPVPPFTTASLQQEASRRLGFGLRKTMSLAQSLFDGVELDGGMAELVTYVRTDSVAQSAGAAASARGIVRERFGAGYLPRKARVFRAGVRNAQEAHEAIRPTDMTLMPETVAGRLGADEAELYRLIWRRTVASHQMAAARLDRVRVELATEAGDVVLTATGARTTFDGFLRVWREDSEEEDTDGGGQDRPLPAMAEGERVFVGEVRPERRLTRAPSRYTEADLVRRLEELGIGRPSTYASVVGMLRERGYAVLYRRRFVPTERGRMVTAFLETYFATWVADGFTTEMEADLDRVAAGGMAWKAVLGSFWGAFDEALRKAGGLNRDDVRGALESALSLYLFGPRARSGPRPCPSCAEGGLVLKLGRYGPFVGCTRYPDCRHSRPLAAESADGGESRGPVPLGTDPESGLALTLRRGCYGRFVQRGDHLHLHRDRQRCVGPGLDLADLHHRDRGRPDAVLCGRGLHRQPVLQEGRADPGTDASRGDGVVLYSLEGPDGAALPAGLSFDGQTRRLTGTPTAVQSATTYTYKAKDSDNDIASLTFTIAVTADDTAPSFGGQTVADQTWEPNEKIEDLTLPAATGGDGVLRYSLTGPDGTGLPPGLSFDPATWTISGTPTVEQGPRTYTYIATDGDAAYPDWVRLTFTIAIAASDGWPLQVSGDGGTIRVAWLGVPDATGYRVQWKSGVQSWSTTERVHEAGAAARSHAIRGLTVGETYDLRAIALGGERGTTVLRTSDEYAQFTHGHIDAYADPAVGDARSIKVEWEEVPGAAGYAIEYGAAGSECHATWVTPPLLDRKNVRGGSTTEATIDMLTPDTNYRIRVTAYTPNGSFEVPDGLSWTDCATPTHTEITEMTVAAVVGSSTELDVTWAIDSVDYAYPIVRYAVQWKTGTDEWSDTNKDTVGNGTATTHRIDGLTVGTTYTVRVAAEVQEFPDIPDYVYDGDHKEQTGTTNGTEAGNEAGATPGGPSFTIYHDPASPAGALGRYDEAVRLLIAAGRQFVVRNVTGSGEVDRLAGLSNSVMPRFFLGDPTDPAWGPSQPGVNNGGLRWLRAQLAAARSSPSPVPAVSVADARVRESDGAVLEFAVTLDRAPGSTATVDYATADGTATAGETEKAVRVTVLDDAHEEGSETLTLSNPSGPRIADGEAAGTIENTDAMPGAWLARMGRTIGGQAVDVLASRFAEGGGTHGRLGGESVVGGGASDETRLAAESPRWRDAHGRDPHARDKVVQTKTLEGFLLGTSFHLTASDLKQSSGPALATWGRATTAFDGEAGGASMDGTVITGFLGADAEWDQMLMGAMVSHSLGEGTYAGSAGNGDVESTLTVVWPYAKFDVGGRGSVWGLAGIGEGDVTLKPDGQRVMETDVSLRMGALGVTGQLLDGEDGLALDARSDAMWIGTQSEAVPGLDASETDVTRLRLVLDGSRTFEVAGGATLTPSAQLGLRVDAGDAETGFGTEVGAGVAWSDPEHGLSGGLTWDPQPSSERGAKLTLLQTLGASESGGVDALLSRDDLANLAANGNGADRWRSDVRLGYGLPAYGGLLTMTLEISVGLSDTAGRDYVLGWRLTPERQGTPTFEFRIEALRRESANDNGAPEHGVELRLSVRW